MHQIPNTEYQLKEIEREKITCVYMYVTHTHTLHIQSRNKKRKRKKAHKFIAVADESSAHFITHTDTHRLRANWVKCD